MLIILGNLVFSQVGIATDTPHASSDLELGAANRALYLNRVADPENDIADPQPGMMLYDTTENCVKVFGGDPAKWSDCMGNPLPVITFNCAAATFTPTSATVNQPYNGSLSIPYTNGNGGTYNADNFTAGGLTFNLPAGNFATGNGTLTYQITGTPTVAGPISVNINQNGVSCTGLTLNVNQAAPPTNPTGTGSLSGRMCFDVVEINDGGDCGTLASRLPQKAKFYETATNTQTYTFKPSGTVSNVRFMYFNTNGQVIQSITPNADYSGTLTSAQTATATVVFYNNLNTTAAGLSRDAAYLGDIYVVYNDGTGDKQLKLTTRVQDCNCCGAMTFANPDGTGGVVWTEFMCHNLGADAALDPFTPAKGIHGGKYRWGNITSPMGVAPSISQAVDQANGDTITGFGTGTGDMSAPDGTWSDTYKTASDPCPVGYRVPTKIEWDGVLANNTMTRSTPLTNWYESSNINSQNYSTGIMFGTSLFLPSEGYRASQARIRNRGAYGSYLSTTTQGTSGSESAFGLEFFYDQYPNTPDGISVSNYTSRWTLNSVRCIAE